MNTKRTAPALITLIMAALLSACPPLNTGRPDATKQTTGGTGGPFTVGFHINEGRGKTPAPITDVAAGSAITLPDDSGFSRDGCSFTGWNTQKDGEGEHYEAAASFTPTTTLMLYAQWNVHIHEWGNWIVMTAPTILADGEESGTCTVCGASATRAIADSKLTSMIEVAQINAGIFTMGSPDDEPSHQSNETEHQVTLTQGFYMGKYPVTQEQYQEVMGSLPSSLTSSTSYGYGGNYPVYYVSWYDALVFCNTLSVKEGLTPAYSIDGETDPDEWGDVPTTRDDTWNAVTIVAGSTGYRLPTEAQWEYACRAGKTTAFNWGTDYIDDSKANYNASYVFASNPTAGTFLSKTTEVGSYAPNDWGLYDMHGNVGEWCWDWYGTYASGSQSDPLGASSGSIRVLRGGSWNDIGRDPRSAFRSLNGPYYRGSSVGFRLLRP